jgi:hypothetical protein
LRNLVGQRFVAEVPVNFTVRDAADGPARRADQTTAAVWGADRQPTLVVAIDESTAEVKYFLTKATPAALSRVLAVAFRRWAVEHSFRLGKQETGLMHSEGRDSTGLLRHLTLALVVRGFVAPHTERLRGEKPTGHGRAGVPGAEPAMRRGVPPAARRARGPTQQRGHPVPPAAQRPGRQVPQETAA